MQKRKINSEIIADSQNPTGQRLTSFVLTFPRHILAELNTHRVFSRNSASSRAIPFKKMVKMCKEDPFIPMAWQKDHSGMQGTEYHDPNKLFTGKDFIKELKSLLVKPANTDEDYVNDFSLYLNEMLELELTLKEWWLFARDRVVETACFMSVFGVSKQTVNRILEPFMWHTAIVSATEFENYFKQRCPIYPGIAENINNTYRSRKDWQKAHHGVRSDWTSLDWLKWNQGGAEIHIMELAEQMWDAMNESTPKQLNAGDWHIPFGEKFNHNDIIHAINEETLKTGRALRDLDLEIIDIKIKIATARCARVSYLNYEGKDDYLADIKLYDRLSSMRHWSPFEHVAEAMSLDSEINDSGMRIIDGKKSYGWYGNFQGFRQQRKTFSGEAGI